MAGFLPSPALVRFCASALATLLSCGMWLGCGSGPDTSEPTATWDIALGTGALPDAAVQVVLATNGEPATLRTELAVERLAEENPTFRLQGREWTMTQPILDLRLPLETAGTGTVRLLVAQLWGRSFHRANPAEVRRSEARKWVTYLRGCETKEPMVLVGDLFDDPGSAVLRTFTDAGWTPLSATDSAGRSWTHPYPEEDSYHRWRYLLVPADQTNRIEAALDDRTRALCLRWRRDAE